VSKRREQKRVYKGAGEKCGEGEGLTLNEVNF